MIRLAKPVIHPIIAIVSVFNDIHPFQANYSTKGAEEKLGGSYGVQKKD